MKIPIPNNSNEKIALLYLKFFQQEKNILN